MANRTGLLTITCMGIFCVSITAWASAVDQAIPERGAVSTVAASRWEDAFLSGNGRMGVMMFGKPAEDTIVVNHWRLYMPMGSREIVPDLGNLLPEIKAKGLKEGPGAVHGFMSTKAKEQSFKFVQTDPFHPAFLLKLKMTGLAGATKNYLMTEDFRSGELAVRWTDERGDWERKVFVSRPDNVVVMSVTGPKGQVGFELGLDISHPLLKTEISAENGWLASHAVYMKGKGGYDSVIRVVASGGKVESGKDRLTVSGADSALVIMRVEPWRAPLPETLSEAWDYSPQNPAFADVSATNRIAETKAALSRLPSDYGRLLKPHQKIHGELFSRVSLDLAGGADRNDTSEKLMARAAVGDKVPLALMERMYDACRYLIICSSGEAVPNLQGIWTGTWTPAWSGDWTIDTNLQLEINSMMSANLPEMMEAYFRLVESWLPDCRVNAKKLYGCRGMVTNARDSNTCLLLHIVDWVGEMFIAGGGWCGHYFYDYYLYAGDREFLKQRCVPLLKEVALFYEDILSGSEGSDGKYRFWLSFSPELHLAPNATFDIAVARETFSNLIAACEELKIENENVPRWKAMLAKMPAYQIGSDGAVKEWSSDGSQNGDNYNHRHYSPMYPVFQSYEFSAEGT
ncbi:MAG: glycoside hydrolase N-terminal domain-containing protein, partial [bacterium]